MPQVPLPDGPSACSISGDAMAKRGRPPLPESERRKPKENVRNVSLDSDLVTALNAVADTLEIRFGFRPTLSQTVRYMVKKELDT